MDKTPESLGKTIGAAMADLRKDCGMTQKNIAEIFNLSESSIAHYEQGITMPNAEILLKIADYFNVNIDYLFGRCNCRVKYTDLNAKVSGSMTFSQMIDAVNKLPKDKRKYLTDTIKFLSEK